MQWCMVFVEHSGVCAMHLVQLCSPKLSSILLRFSLTNQYPSVLDYYVAGTPVFGRHGSPSIKRQQPSYLLTPHHPFVLLPNNYPPYSTTSEQQKTPKHKPLTAMLSKTAYKRMIVCCDGTWQASDKSAGGSMDSNVTKFSRALSKTVDIKGHTVQQIVYYASGIGTDGLTRLSHYVAGKWRNEVF